jgi:cytochrome c
MKKQLIFILSVSVSSLALFGFVTIHEKKTDFENKKEVNSVSTVHSGVSSLATYQQPTPLQTRDKGVGPIKELKLEPVNQKLVNDGKGLFTAKCTLCHSLDQKIIGPPLRKVTSTRSPEYIMNMILNPTNMEKEDPIVKELHKNYLATPMTDQSFTQAQARALLEYLRSVAK